MTKKPRVVTRQRRRAGCGASAAPQASPLTPESCDTGAEVVVAAPESASLPQDPGLASLQTDLAAWAVDTVSGLDSVLQSLLVPDCEWLAAPIDRTCKYRKGRCSQPRTLKKSGDLHSFCDYHRQKSIQNQRRFDQKQRLLRLARLSKGTDRTSSRTRTDDSDTSSTPSSPNDDDHATAAAPVKSLERSEDATQGTKRSRTTCTGEDGDRDGECRCGKKCKDVRYDINFIIGTSVVI